MARTLKLTMPVPDETTEQMDLMDKIARLEYRYPQFMRVYHIPNGARASGFKYTGRDGKERRACPEGKRMKAMGVRPGYPDLGYDEARGGYFGLRIELKTTDASPCAVSKEQREWHAFLRDMHFAVFVCKGAAAAWRVLIWYDALAPTTSLGNVEPLPADMAGFFVCPPSEN